MNKQDLRYSYLSYFAGQYAKKEKLSFDTLEEMAGGNFNLEKEVLKDLINEELIEGIEVFEDERATRIIQHNENLKLTAKGIKEILNLFPDEKKEIINDIRSEINKNNDCKNQKSKKDKFLSIKRDLLILFADIVQGKQYTKSINNKNINRNINLIIKKYYYKAYPKNKEIIEELKKEKLITINYEAIKTLDDLRKIINVNGIVYLQKNYDYKFEIFDQKQKNGLKMLADKIKPATMPNDLIKQSTNTKIDLSNDYLKSIANNYKNLSGNHLEQALRIWNSNEYQTAINIVKQNINNFDTIKGTINKTNNNTTQTPNNTKKSKEQNKQLKNSAYTFKGVLGHNCGEVVTPTSEDDKRIQEKGFKVENGIKVLRGFANSAILAVASKKDENYQREENIEHLNAIEKFIENMRASAKYLPEVTLIARGYEKLERINLSGTLSKTQKGELDNLEYYKLTVSADKLYRIDGNHRLEALKEDNYYIPFSIIIWEDTDINLDDEAFLFYFLNSKAKKLTTEENIKGLVNAKNWTDNELETANVVLPYIKYFKDKFEEHTLFNRDYYRNSHGLENVKTQILNVLELINKETGKDILPFNKKTFGNYIGKLQEILSQRDRFKYLRKHFRCFPQFIFYTLYKYDGNIEDSIRFINAVNKWAEGYKHDSNSFIQPDKMFYNASKQLDRKINIFVAMPFYNQTIVDQFNKTLESIIEDIKQEDEILKDKLNLYPIMTYKAESTDILANMDKQIGECDIFIADISNHGKSKVNPNVMFELGRVYDKKKFLLIRNKDNKISNSAFDIQHIDYIPIDYGMGFDASMKENLKPRIMNIVKNIIGLC